MNYSDIRDSIALIRSNIISVYNEMCDCNNPLLPPKDTEFASLKSYLDDEQYDVVVCGEVKKGKSSFINAIIGEDLLPVNTDVATSQVFRIVNSDEKRYELVFVDGKRKPISRVDLTKYGSQIAANKDGLPLFDVAIDFIEIHYPIVFLPKNIAIVDTPGIGAVYADHEQITRRYIKKAAAVIFIMDPQNTLTAPEKSFVESTLDVTDRIVFVMTKMDNYDPEYIVNLVRRNEEILQPLAERTWKKNIQVLPMSSKILKNAAENEDEILRNLDLEFSQYDKVQEAVLQMVYAMIGLGKNIVYTNQLIAYDRSVKVAIKESEEALNDNGGASTLLKDRQRLQDDFASQWGPQSSNYKGVVQAITDEANSIPNKIAIICGQSGHIAQRFKDEIKTFSSVDEAKQYANDFSTRIQDAVQKAVSEEVGAVSDNINEKLHRYYMDITEYVTSNRNVTLEGFTVDPINMDDGGWSKSIGGFRMGYINVMLFVGIGAMFGPIGAAAGFVAGIIANLLMSREEKIREAQVKCRDYLARALQAAYNSLCVEANPLSQVEQIKRDVKQQAGDALRKVYDEQKSKVDARIQELTQQINANAIVRQQKQQQLNNLRTQWTPVSTHLLGLVQNIESLKNTLQAL